VIPSLHIVTDDEILSRPDFVPTARGVLEAGGDRIALHLRGPRTPGRSLYSVARSLKPAAQAVGGKLLANDRVDLALALDLQGAHLGQRSLSPPVARRILGFHRLLGLSVHGIRETEEVPGGMVDFLLVGTIFPSSSHPGVTPGGLERLREVQGVTALPLLAIGGITTERVGEAMSAGVHGVAVRGGIWDAVDPMAATGGYLLELRKGKPE
jgi:thiamine-phosphate diphosphorylase